MLGASIASTALQFVVAMTFVLPPIAERLSARDLASHFNAQGALPNRLLMAEERVGSLIFYLDLKLRRQLTPGQIEQYDPEKSIEPAALDVIVIPQRRRKQAEEYLDLRGWKSESVGRYLMYRKAEGGQRKAE